MALSPEIVVGNRNDLDQRRKSMECLSRASLAAWRMLSGLSYNLKTKTDKAEELITLAGQQIQQYANILCDTKSLNSRCNASISENERISYDLCLKKHELEIQRMKQLVEHSRLASELHDKTESLQVTKHWLESETSELLKATAKVTKMITFLDERKKQNEILREHNQKLAEEIKEKSELLRSRTVMMHTMIHNMGEELNGVNLKTKAIEGISAQLKRRIAMLKYLQRQQSDSNGGKKECGLFLRMAITMQNYMQYWWQNCRRIFELIVYRWRYTKQLREP
ncbi:uncharacterized protein LOC115633264 [Scaptodrosophila lebanonensis]|uniref:Uncharacterized protein LOC115633264 n=1 Tax=Drosophila lebanonensis TaxID=7225 RepID=A0A6J2UGJ9_DROLE|nr:uncharacterized protein LOC115633264 [Scaptodrosophila lebanonensis]